jgi:LacI family transcriptional regulator
MAAAGIAADPAWIAAGDFGYESGERAASELLALAEPVTAIVASSEQMALATLHVARKRGLKIPRDLSIVSFDDTPGARHAMPPLTAINQPIAKMAERAADLLIAASAGQDVDRGIRILPFGLVARESTAPHGG